MYIGVGNRNAPTLGGGGMLYIDDISLYAPRCFPSLAKPAADFDNSCVVDYPDLDIMTNNWLISTYDVTPAAPSDANLVANYKFENNLLDSSGNGNHADPCGAPSYVAGQVGSALEFDGIDDYVRAPHIPFDNRSFTIAMWVNPVLYTDQQVVFAQHQAGSTNLSMHFRLGGPGIGGGNVPLGGVRMAFYANDLDTAGGIIQDNTWYHITFWYDFENQNRKIYVNGVQEAQGAATPYLGTSGDTRIGQWNNSQWFRGIIDEVRIYNKALSQAEVANLAGKTATFTQPLYPLLSPPDPAIDMNADGTVDLKDYALLADTFLDEKLWP